MKKLLLINGSPKGKASNTRKLTSAFLKGLNKNNEYEVEEIICSQLDISDCRGCFYCWKNEKGECSINDEMSVILKKYIAADIIIWSFPNYFYGMPSCVKRVLDRLLPLYCQKQEIGKNNNSYHVCRFDFKNQKHLLFCSCGLYSADMNAEGIKTQFELMYGGSCDMLFCSEGQFLSNSFMDYRTKDYLDALEEEGAEYAKRFVLSDKIKEMFKTPFLPINEFILMADSSAALRKNEMTEQEYAYEKVRSFFKNMSYTYDASVLFADNSVLEVYITDYDYTCQLHMDKNKCVLVEDTADFVPYRLKVISKLSFFASNPNLAKFENQKAKGPDINALVNLINKFEKKGITKELRFS